MHTRCKNPIYLPTSQLSHQITVLSRRIDSPPYRTKHQFSYQTRHAVVATTHMGSTGRARFLVGLDELQQSSTSKSVLRTSFEMIKLPRQRVHGVSVSRSCFLLEQARYISATAPLRPCYKLRNNSSLRRAKAQEWLRVYKGGLRDVLGEGVYVQMKQGVHFPGMRVKFCPTSYQTNTKQTVPLSLHLFSRTTVHWWLSRTSVSWNGSDFRIWGQNIHHVHVNFSPRRRQWCFSQTTLLPGLFAYANVDLLHPCSQTSSYSEQLLIFYTVFWFGNHN